MTASTLGLGARPLPRSDADWLTHAHRPGIDGLEAPLGSLDGDEKDVRLDGLVSQPCQAQAIWPAGTMETGHAEDIFDTVYERPSVGENTININCENNMEEGASMDLPGAGLLGLQLLLGLFEQVMCDSPSVASVKCEQFRTSEVEDLPPAVPCVCILLAISLLKMRPQLLSILDHG